MGRTAASARNSSTERSVGRPRVATRMRASPQAKAGETATAPGAEMPRRIERDEVRRLAADGAHILDVLPRRAYQALHIAGAVNIPLGVVYCNDYT
jgi:hypothetical protein